MQRRSLFKYYSERRWAEAFMRDGEMLFSSLAVFRDHEDNNARADPNEGILIDRRKDGHVLTFTNKKETLQLPPDHGLQCKVDHAEIFIFCLSRSLNARLQKDFAAVTCIEITDIATFCRKVETALIKAAYPHQPTFPGGPGRTRIGHDVIYYNEFRESNVDWALPGRIAISKQASYTWQDEFRLVFSLTDALDFQKTALSIGSQVAAKGDPIEHHRFKLQVPQLSDICRFHDLS